MAEARHLNPKSARFGWLRSVRFRLLVIAILPMLVVMPLLLGANFNSWSRKFDDLLIAKVNGELTIAHQYLARILETSEDKTKALGGSAEFTRVLAAGTEQDITTFLERKRREIGMDFLYLLDLSGNFAALDRAGSTDYFKGWPVPASALEGRARTEIDLFSQKELALFSEELAHRARIDLVPTKAAVPTRRKVESRGMVVHTAAPLNLAGEPAALVGGVLLNRNLEFIDTINDLVYPAASLTDGSKGTATLFLEDVRISTNVRLFENVRALGTRVSAIVRSSVLDEGKIWLNRAFVVNDWYISAYEPIVDSHGTRIGMLYVGFLDSPFRQAKMLTLWTTIGAFLAAVALSVPIFLRWARAIFRPLENMLRTIAKVETGELGARTGLTNADDEIGKVALHLDGLLGQVQDRDARLREWAAELNQRVEERTAELRDANKRLEATTKQLVVSEKLAAIGEITAGIAHEINNPIAVIQGNVDVIRQELGSNTEQLETEFNLIDQQVHSVNVLVSKLLQFARPDEYFGSLEYQKPDDALTDCLVLVQHLLNKVAIDVLRSQKAEGMVAMNRTELQQVLINLIVNAIHAMPDGGTLSLTTRNVTVDKEQGITLSVQDTGKGMAKSVVEKIFDPFFTTKARDGTGLGLSISQTIINRYGGRISVDSTLGQGTVFAVWLPLSKT